MAQALAVSAANAQESLTCVKCLVQLVRGSRVCAASQRASTDCAAPAPLQAVHQIAGLRGLFPDDAFKRRDIAGLPNVMELKVRPHLCRWLRCLSVRESHSLALQADHSPETRLVCDWVDRGTLHDAMFGAAAFGAPRLLRSESSAVSALRQATHLGAAASGARAARSRQSVVVAVTSATRGGVGARSFRRATR